MTTALNPYLRFRDQAREAFDFYASVLGGTPEVLTFGQADPGASSEIADLVMHSFLRTSDGYELMGSDTPPGMDAPSGSAVTLSLSGDEPKLREYFKGLSEGGEVQTPLEKQSWGDEYGSFVDRFGIEWMVNLGTGEHAAQEPNDPS